MNLSMWSRKPTNSEQSFITMPQETLAFPPAYCIVGAYRLAHDDTLWKPMWKECKDAAKKAGMVAAGWAIFTWPIQKLFVYYFMRGSAKVTGMST